MDKLTIKPLHRRTRFELIVTTRELEKQFMDYKFRTDKKLHDQAHQIKILQNIHEHVNRAVR